MQQTHTHTRTHDTRTRTHAHTQTTVSNPDYTKLEAWKSYVQFEEQKNEPARVQMVYERVLQRYCLVPDLWISYVTYLVRLLTREVVQERERVCVCVCADQVVTMSIGQPTGPCAEGRSRRGALRVQAGRTQLPLVIAALGQPRSRAGTFLPFFFSRSVPPRVQPSSSSSSSSSSLLEPQERASRSEQEATGMWPTRWNVVLAKQTSKQPYWLAAAA